MNRDAIIELVQKLRLDQHQRIIQDSLSCSVRIRPEIAFNPIPPGASQIGGAPDLPQGTAWPARGDIPMAPLCQIQLSDVGNFEGNVLPRTGWLNFFYDMAGRPWGYDPEDHDGARVLFFDGDVSSLRRFDPPEEYVSQLDPELLRFELDWTLPDEELIDIPETDLPFYRELLAKLDVRQPIHRMLGHAQSIQGPMQVQCQLVSNGLYCGDGSCYDDPRAQVLARDADQWVLLLQLDSGAICLPGDMGRLYFWIRKEDLAAKDFSHVWVIHQST